MSSSLGVFLLAAAIGCTSPLGRCTSLARITFSVTVPEGSETVYIAGNIDALGPWVPDALALDGAGRERTVTITAAVGFELEYKFTLGSWDREALGPSGTVMPNFKLNVGGDATVEHTLNAFKADPTQYMADWQASGVQGTLVYWPDVSSAFLERDRAVVIWLPPGFDASGETRYPVLYMHDGQNLFDPRIGGSNGDIWDVDDAIVDLVDAGIMDPVIVVGAFNTADRIHEYSPWHGAPAYARFLIEELMPRINAEFPTRTGPEHTAVMGSSMGGLLSYYLVSNHSDVFSACGCISSHFSFSEAMAAWFKGQDTASLDPTPYILGDIERGLAAPASGRFWFDYGTEGLDAEYAEPHAALRQWLLDAGRIEGSDFVVKPYPGADHNEASWRDRLKDPLTFIFGRTGT